jgi:hypothetical protein
MDEAPIRLWAAPGGGSHWKVYRGETWLGWVHRLDYRRWVPKRPDGTELPEAPTRRDAIAALTCAS